MKLQYLLTSFGLLTIGLSFSGSAAQAFSFTTNLTSGSTDPTGNLFLQSVSLSNGTTISNFSLVNSATIISNDNWTGGNSGAASSDRGDNASGTNLERATSTSIATSLGNLNLNNIIDTEDRGAFKINVSFEQAVSNLFFWERGMNSQLGVQALDSNGSLIGNLLTLDSRTWQYAGFGIDTTEIAGTQRVGSLGVSLADLGVSGPIHSIQLTSTSAFNGPDFKVIGGTAAVPEPTTMAGLALAGIGLTTLRRRQSKKTA